MKKTLNIVLFHARLAVVPCVLLSFVFYTNLSKALDANIIDSPMVVTKLENQGISLAEHLLSLPKASTNQQLLKNPLYSSMVEVISKDLDKLKADDKYLSVTMAKKHRLFNKRWLRSKAAFFELIGVAPRFDMAVFEKPEVSCGEIRLIYRLAYSKKWRGQPVYSRLPLTLNVVFSQEPKKGDDPKLSCQKLAKAWQALNEDALSSYLKQNLQKQQLKSVEVNLQAVRWPSTVRPDFGGYAEYILRVFELDKQNNKLKPTTMLNTLDVAKIRSSLKLKKDLKEFLLRPATVKQVDRGTLKIPKRFLATKAVSFAFHGQHRMGNRLLDQIFEPKDFKKLDFKKQASFKTPQAFMRRVNDHSCVGCHQGRSIAGFHFVGVDKKNSFAANQVLFARSGHLRNDIKRRQKYLSQLVSSGTPDPSRGFSERAPSEQGKYGAHCSMGRDPSFIDWKCERGLTCQQLLDNKQKNSAIGTCLPPGLGTGGDPSEVGVIDQKANARKDRLYNKKHRSCASGYNYFDARDGFPSGICYKDCPLNKSSLKASETCGLIAFNGFNPCLARGEAFTKCLSKYTGELVLQKCDAKTSCRDDYVCSKTKNNEGACIPPYFLFQLRLDGHPAP